MKENIYLLVENIMEGAVLVKQFVFYMMGDNFQNVVKELKLILDRNVPGYEVLKENETLFSYQVNYFNGMFLIGNLEIGKSLN